MSICPKNKSSKGRRDRRIVLSGVERRSSSPLTVLGRRDRRRANWKMTAPNLVKCSKCGALMMPHRVCKACGSYNKKEILANAE